MDKKRILHIVECAGGVERYLLSLLKYIDHNQYENVAVVSHNYNGSKIDTVADSVEVIDMHHSIGFENIRVMKNVRKLIKKYNPDIVYVHSSIAGAVVRIAMIGINVKCVYNSHGWAFNMICSDKKRKMYILIERLLSNFCDKIVCISEKEKESAIVNNICSPEKLEVILNGIDVEKRNIEDTDILGLDLVPKDAYIIGTVGRLTKQKAPDVFVECARMVKEKIPNAFFIIVGDGEEKIKIQELIKDYGLEKSFLITGWVENTAQYINLFDVALLLSRWEGFGLVIPEYMLAGKPIIATRVDAIPTILTDGINGLLVEVDDYVAASDAILKLNRNKVLRERLVENASKEVYKKYDAKRMAKEHCLLFEKLTSI